MPLKKHKEYSAENHDRQQTIRKADPDVKSEGIETWVGPNDVLTGRGAPQTDHEGNVRLRQLVIKFQPEYGAAKRQQIKQSIATRIVDKIESRGGRFLRKVGCKMGEHEQQAVTDGGTSGNVQQSLPISGNWVVVNDRKQIMEKVKQLLRDMGPESRERRHIRRLYRFRKLGMKPGESCEVEKPLSNADDSTPGYGTTAKRNSDATKQLGQQSVLHSERAKSITHDFHPYLTSAKTFPSGVAVNTDTARQLWHLQNDVKSEVPHPQIWSVPWYAHLVPPRSSFSSNCSNSLIPTTQEQSLRQQMMFPHLSIGETGIGRASAMPPIAQPWTRMPVPLIGRATVGHPLPNTSTAASTSASASTRYHTKLPSHSTELDNSIGSRFSPTAYENPELSSVRMIGAGRKPTPGDSVVVTSTKTKPDEQKQKSSIPRSSNV